MLFTYRFLVLLLGMELTLTYGVQPPAGLVTRSGDQCIVLHWDPSVESVGYRVYRASASGGPFTSLNTSLVTSPGYCDLTSVNGTTNFYRVTAVLGNAQETDPSVTVAAAAHPFASDDEFLEFVQEVHFDYFWYLANPKNGLVPDRSAAGSACSIAAVGFGLTAIGIGVDHGWISRTQGVARVSTTLSTFLNEPQSSAASGTIGYKGWFYHFLDMNSGLRSGAELSSIDTALLLGGVLSAKQYFDGNDAAETSLRGMADELFNRVDWNWMARGSNAVSMGWFPETGFIGQNWIGYNEGSILYLLGLGANSNALPSAAWPAWTSGYQWGSYYGEAFIPFAPLFAHQYSQCWFDLRHVTDAYTAAHETTYFENSRRATLAQRSYCIANPKGAVGYSSNVWGLTACDGPSGYGARGAPGPQTEDDGTIAPTAAGGSMPFTPEYSLSTLRYFYSHFRQRIWTAYGFRDAFNLGAQWWDNDELGIDQGPIVIMIENYRTQRPWQLFMQNAEVQRGLQRAGFAPVNFLASSLQLAAGTNSVTLAWLGSTGRTYQVEYSPDLGNWLPARDGEVTASSPAVTWIDQGPPGTNADPLTVSQRFYRVFEFGEPWER